MPDHDPVLDDAIREIAAFSPRLTCASGSQVATGISLTLRRRRGLMSLQVNAMREETINTTALREQIEGLRHMTVGQLRIKYREVFGEESRSNHKQFLFRRGAWRIQANAEGGLSERARAAAHSRSPTTPTFASARRRTS